MTPITCYGIGLGMGFLVGTAFGHYVFRTICRRPK